MKFYNYILLAIVFQLLIVRESSGQNSVSDNHWETPSIVDEGKELPHSAI
ncbi:MAG: hypothetical protein LBS55_13540 [Prevotellaceae bacterium]|jgi:hypothetical protein|nr:hypothetical protein [Prevotellaceae bacterium]